MEAESMSPDEADRFLDDVVRPTVDEFLYDNRNIRDLRRAKLACIVVASLVDYIIEERQELRDGCGKVEALRHKLADRCLSYKWVWNICDATKHMRLRRGFDISQIQQSATLLATEDGRVIAKEDRTPIAAWSGVAVLLPNGDEERVDHHVKKALEYLIAMMGREEL
jgi:hypothetical protein